MYIYIRVCVCVCVCVCVYIHVYVYVYVYLYVYVYVYMYIFICAYNGIFSANCRFAASLSTYTPSPGPRVDFCVCLLVSATGSAEKQNS
jgi:hypothetical protein